MNYLLVNLTTSLNLASLFSNLRNSNTLEHLHYLKICSSMCSPQISSISITWAVFRNEESQALSRTTESEWATQIYILQFEKHYSRRKNLLYLEILCFLIWQLVQRIKYSINTYYIMQNTNQAILYKILVCSLPCLHMGSCVLSHLLECKVYYSYRSVLSNREPHCEIYKQF